VGSRDAYGGCARPVPYRLKSLAPCLGLQVGYLVDVLGPAGSPMSMACDGYST
jgi:hypothetical protein